MFHSQILTIEKNSRKKNYILKKERKSNMLNEISNYFDICLEGIIKTVTLPIGILGIIIKYLIKESK